MIFSSSFSAKRDAGSNPKQAHKTSAHTWPDWGWEAYRFNTSKTQKENYFLLLTWTDLLKAIHAMGQIDREEFRSLLKVVVDQYVETELSGRIHDSLFQGPLWEKLLEQVKP